jgi:hypothetical protein
MFSDDGAASYPCKENYLEELHMSRKKQRKENSTPLEKLELIYIGIKPIY